MTDPSVAAELPQEPWRALAPSVAQIMRPGIARTSAEVVAAIAREIPAYAQPIEGELGMAVQRAVEEALTRFVDLLEGVAPPRTWRESYFELGRVEQRAGRPLEALLAGYRLGARVAWRRVAGTAREAGLGEEGLELLAESIFAYIDELSAESVAGFAHEQSATAAERELRRERLLRLMIQSPPADPHAVEAAAAAAGWGLPGSLAALAWRGEDGDRVASRLPLGTLSGEIDDLRCALVPDPEGPGRRAELSHALGERTVVLGPAVGWRDAALSAARAIAALPLVERGTIEGGRLVAAEEHLATLIAQGDPSLLEDLARLRLAPLADLSALARRRLAETLRAWLDHQGNVPAAAAVLYVHPQTVRYRFAQLRELFGSQLDDPDARYELQLVLRSVSVEALDALFVSG